MDPRLPTVSYHEPGRPSLFELWATKQPATLPAPLACSDEIYQNLLIEIIKTLPHVGLLGPKVVSLGAGTGVLEKLLAEVGLEVFATDSHPAAVEACAQQGLRTVLFDILGDKMEHCYDVIYCDGVMGHLWQPASRCESTWYAFADMACEGAHAVISNDLADGDEESQFDVQSDPSARFYRPPRGYYANDGSATGMWSVLGTRIYSYKRRGKVRRREIVVAKFTGAQ